MATHVALYIKTEDTDKLAEKLSSLTGLQRLVIEKFPDDYHNHFIMDDSLPFYYLIGAEQKDWLTVYYNNFDKRVAWCKLLSAEYATQVISVMLQTTSDYYYFALYDKGEQLREIEVCYGGDIETINTGEKLTFEEEQIIETDGDFDYFFDDMEIERYCQHFNLSIRPDNSNIQWQVLKGEKAGKTLADTLPNMNHKPWWKFW